MRICRISQTYPTKENEGKGLHTFFISNLIEEPTLVLTKNYDEEYLKPASHVKLKRIKYWQIPFPESNKFSLRWFMAFLSFVIGQCQFAIKSMYHLSRFKPEIVHLQSPHAFLIGWYAKIFYSSKVITTFHGSDLKRLAKNMLFIKFLNRFDRFFYVTSQMRPTLINYFGKERLLYTPSGVDVDFFLNDCDKRDRENILLAVGNLRWQKNYPTMLKAFSKVLKIFPDYKLVIIGSGSLKETKEIQEIIEKLNIGFATRLLGYQNRFAVRNYMWNSKLFLLSSVTEGMPKVIHESLCSKLPVVATDVGGCRNLVGDAGKVVKAENPDAFAKAIIFLLKNPEQYNNCVDRSQERGTKYSWKSNSEIILNEFKKLLINKR